MAEHNIIKTRARYQEAEEPSKQRPVIHVGLAGSQQLPNTIRASLETGRDNPFKPGGPIYRSADPIVDFYKQAANQSRPTSPTDSQLLLQVEGGGPQLHPEAQSKSEGQAKVKACWRRWLCCCCCCNLKSCCRSNRNSEVSGQLKPTTNTRQDEQQVRPASSEGAVSASPSRPDGALNGRNKSKCSVS